MRPQYSILLLMAWAASVPGVVSGQIQNHQPAVPLTLVEAIDFSVLQKPVTPATKKKIKATPVKHSIPTKNQPATEQAKPKTQNLESAPAVEPNSPLEINPNTQKRIPQTAQAADASVEQIASLPTAPLSPLARSPFPRTRASKTYQRPSTDQTGLTQPFPIQSTQEFEFGTVMSFPARPDKPAPPAILTQDRNVPTTEPAPKPRFQNASAIVSPPKSIMIAPRTQSEVLATRVLAPSIMGPSSLTPNVPGDFQIVVANTSDQPVTDVIVQLSLPQEMIITKFYRQAWLNNETRSLSWKIDQIQPGQKETIRYSVRSTHTGKHQQTVSLGMQNVNQGVVPFTTLVVPK